MHGTHAAPAVPSLPSQHISNFIDWLIGQLKRPSNPSKSVPSATSVLSVLLKERGSRHLFLRAGGASLLPPLLKSSNNPSNAQLLYELCLCVWQLSFIAQAAEAMGTAGAQAAHGAQLSWSQQAMGARSRHLVWLGGCQPGGHTLHASSNTWQRGALVGQWDEETQPIMAWHHGVSVYMGGWAGPGSQGHTQGAMQRPALIPHACACTHTNSNTRMHAHTPCRRGQAPGGDHPAGPEGEGVPRGAQRASQPDQHRWRAAQRARVGHGGGGAAQDCGHAPDAGGWGAEGRMQHGGRRAGSLKGEGCIHGLSCACGHAMGVADPGLARPVRRALGRGRGTGMADGGEGLHAGEMAMAAAGHHHYSMSGEAGVSMRVLLLTGGLGVQTLQAWGDEDIPEMLGFMEDKLKEGIQVRAGCEPVAVGPRLRGPG